MGIEVQITKVTFSEVIPAPAIPSLEARQAARAEPSATPVMFQTWSNLCFLHWEWDPAEIQKTLPPGLFVDTHQGKACLAVTPFFMTDVRASFLPEIAGTGNFLELNVRTYVYDRHGTPGVWFYSLDCNQSLAVLLAKAFYSLPYQSADMEARERSGMIEYRSHRRGTPPSDQTEIHYHRQPETIPSPPGSLPFFLVERYVLFAWASRAKRLYTARVSHMPYDLFHVNVGRFDDAMLRLNGFNSRLRRPDHCAFASPVRVKIYALEVVPA